MDTSNLTPCGTCPWRTKLHGTKHPAGWYKASNLRRLWNGIRTGKAPGMVCHSTDSRSAEYGSTKAIPGTIEPRECAGVLILVQRHLDDLGQNTMLFYRLKWGRMGMTTVALRRWANRILFGKSIVIHNANVEEFSIPGERGVL